MAAEVRELREEVITLRGGLNYLKRSAKLDEPKFAINSLTGEKVTLVPYQGSQSIFILPSFIGRLDQSAYVIGPPIKYMCVERVHVYTVAKIFYPSLAFSINSDSSSEQNIQRNKDTRATIKKTFMDQYCDQVFPLSKFKYLADNAVRHTKEDLTWIHNDEKYYYEEESFIVKLSNRNGDYASICNPTHPPHDTKFGSRSRQAHVTYQLCQPILVEFFL